jgi:hypothetical protein
MSRRGSKQRMDRLIGESSQKVVPVVHVLQQHLRVSSALIEGGCANSWTVQARNCADALGGWQPDGAEWLCVLALADCSKKDHSKRGKP